MGNFYKNRWVIFLVVLIGVVLRLINFTDGLGLDEIWSMITSGADKSTMDIIEACKNDTHPPFFDLLMHYFILIVGDTEFAGRILALILGVLGMIATYYYVKKISKNDFAAFIALVLISFSFFHIYFSGQGRFYTLLYLLSLIAIAELYLYFLAHEVKRLQYFVIASVILVYTHYYGAILLFSLAILVFVLWLVKEINRKQFLHFCMAGGAIAVSFLPWLPNMLANNAQESWMRKPNLGFFFEYLYNYTGKNPVEALFVLAALILSVKIFKKNKVLFTLLYGSIVLGFLIPYTISHLTLPMLHYRYTAIYFPSIILIASIYWGQQKLVTHKVANMLFSVVFVSILVNFFFINKHISGEGEQPWRKVAQDIVKNEHADIVIYTEQPFHMNYYLDRNNITESELPDKQLADEFWYLKTTFDKTKFDCSATHSSVKSVDYGNEFILTQYRIK